MVKRLEWHGEREMESIMLPTSEEWDIIEKKIYK